MTTPSQYAAAYADLWSWLLIDGEWTYSRTPITSYLQNGLKQTSISADAQLAHRQLMQALATATKRNGIANEASFKFNGDDYINLSITRTFIGKACPWEIQETMMLASQLKLVPASAIHRFCTTRIGVDCGGFVANYWGIGVPHMVAMKPWGAWGISPRSFWADAQTWPDVMKRRRASAGDVRPGDAAVFFKGIKDDNPDLMAKKDKDGKVIKDTGSEAFHIGVVEAAGASGGAFSLLKVAESSGAGSVWGGDGVNVRTVNVAATGVSQRKWVFADNGKGERIYFVAPPAGWGPEMPYTYGEE